MDERLRFVARLLEGEKMAPLCAEFGISRKTGFRDELRLIATHPFHTVRISLTRMPGSRFDIVG